MEPTNSIQSASPKSQNPQNAPSSLENSAQNMSTTFNSAAAMRAQLRRSIDTPTNPKMGPSRVVGAAPAPLSQSNHPHLPKPQHFHRHSTDAASFPSSLQYQTQSTAGYAHNINHTNANTGSEKYGTESIESTGTGGGLLGRTSIGSEESMGWPFGLGGLAAKTGTTRAASMSFGEDLDDESLSMGSPRRSTQMLRAQRKQAKQFVTDRVQTIRQSLMTDADGNIHVRDTWNHMKTRAWKRYKTSLRWRKTFWAQWWGVLYLSAFIVFVCVRTIIFDAANAEVFIMMGALLIIAYRLTNRYLGVYSLLVFELMFAVYIYFLLNPKLKQATIVPNGAITNLLFLCLIITPTVMLISAIVYHFFPYFLYYTKAYTHLGLKVTSQQYIDLLNPDIPQNDEMHIFETKIGSPKGVVSSEENGHEQWTSDTAGNSNNQSATSSGAMSKRRFKRERQQRKLNNQKRIPPSVLRDQFAIAHHGDADYYSAVILVEMQERRRDYIVFHPDEYLYLYVGPLLNGRPHGLGQWIDSSPQGENLFGYFDAGIPVGPYRSNENSTNTRSSFVNLRIVYTDNCHPTSALKHVPMVFGVASVECAVSGENLLGWPKAFTVKEPEVCQCSHIQHCVCATTMLDLYYRHLDDTKRLTSITVSVDESWNGLKVSGHRPADYRRQREVRIRLGSERQAIAAAAESSPVEMVRKNSQKDVEEDGALGEDEKRGMNDSKNLSALSLSPNLLMRAKEIDNMRVSSADVDGKPKQDSSAKHAAVSFKEEVQTENIVQDVVSEEDEDDSVKKLRDLHRQQPSFTGFRDGMFPQNTSPAAANGHGAEETLTATHHPQSPPPLHSSAEKQDKQRMDGNVSSLNTTEQLQESDGNKQKTDARGERYDDDVALLADSRWLAQSGAEAIIYVHGYKHTRVDIVRRFGQFLAMANLPPSIKPFMFHWPSGRGATSYFPAYASANSDEVVTDFEHLLYSLRNSGVMSIHLMLHSMGARVFFNAWEHLKHMFLPAGVEDILEEDDPEDAVTTRLRASTQEMSRDRFGTSSDDSSPMYNHKLFLSNLILLNPDYELSIFQQEAASMREYSPRMTLYVDRRDAALKLAQACTSRMRLGYLCEPLCDDHGRVVDIDIIDTTDLDSNIGGSYHSFWNINRSVVDDIHELITNQVRAGFRSSRLILIEGVYRFIQTPSHIIEV